MWRHDRSLCQERGHRHLLVISDGAAIEEPDGQQADVVTARMQEMVTATKILGIQQVQTLGLPDGQLALHTAQVHEAIQKQLVTFHLTSCWLRLPSMDITTMLQLAALHSTCSAVLLAGCLAFYEVLALYVFNMLVEITDVASIKEQAIRCYQRSLFQQPDLFWEAFRALNMAKSAFVHRAGLFEAFWVFTHSPTDHEIITWATYGFQSCDNEQPTLRMVKDIDDLVFALGEKTRALTSIEQQHNALRDETRGSRTQAAGTDDSHRSSATGTTKARKRIPISPVALPCSQRPFCASVH